jgi:tetratricopeptide (TPR) repeat protein/predicted aspartyl protease
MSRSGVWLMPAALLAGGASHAAVAAGCVVERWAQLLVTMDGTRPLIHAQINGSDALFLADSGAFYSSLTTAAASQYRLTLYPAPFGFEVRGIGGGSRPSLTEVAIFTLFGMPFKKVQFLVLPNDLGTGVAGIVGQNVFRISDVEYDLANGVIRMVRTRDCKKAMLAYWARDTEKPVSVIDIEFGTPTAPHTRGVAYVNGTKIRVLFDTGASTSYLTIAAAKRAGVTPESPGVVDGGMGGGIGSNLRRSWIAPFASFKVGDEEVRNTRLRIGEGNLLDEDMLVGADFFLSHRIYVSNGQHQLFFTYNGGPVFNLKSTPSPPATATSEGGSAATAAEPGAAASPATAAPGENLDAAALARRGAASAGRHDYEYGLADLTRAIAMAPNEPGYYYERGRVYLDNGKPDLALADFDQAIKLRPDDVPSLLARAELHASRHDPAEVLTADLEVANRAAAHGAEERVHLGDLYQYAGNMPAAVAQYSAWIEVHAREDVSMPRVLNSRCWARAQWGQELDRALDDCNGALRLRPNNPAFLDSRGLVYLRQRNYDRAIADYDASLKLRSNSAWVLYCRGLAKQRKGPAGAGKTDMDAALAQQPSVAARAAKLGLSP